MPAQKPSAPGICTLGVVSALRFGEAVPRHGHMRLHEPTRCVSRSPFGSHVAEHLLDALAAAAAGGDDATHGRVQQV